jgi:hypothetical protein
MNREILEELQSVLKGKTLDALIPPLVFVMLQSRVELWIAGLAAALVSLAFAGWRRFKKQSAGYAFGGLVSVLVATIFALYADSASNYFLPGILSNTAITLGLVVMVILDRPVAAYLSHLTRGWKLDWFWRKDVKPAYREVSWFWTAAFAVATGLRWFYYLQGDVAGLAVLSTILGLPFTIAILIPAYIYGLWRLRHLKGPGIDEYLEGKSPPYRGQTRGF